MTDDRDGDGGMAGDGAMPRQKRRLLAILHADVVDYSRHMERDEVGTWRRIVVLRRRAAEVAAARGGRVVGTAGDAVLVDYPSVVDALEAALAMQEANRDANAGLPDDERLELRIGINLGDVIDYGGDLFGDGVNVAERVQTLADPGGVAVSGPVHEQARHRPGLRFEDRGSHYVKNIADPVHVYAVSRGNGRTARRLRAPSWSLALGLAALVLLAAGAALWSLGLVRYAPEQAADILSGKPTVAILPFEDRSAGAPDPWFSDGITEDIIAKLGRFSSLYVLSWSAVAPYRDSAVTPEELSRALGVRYVVGGSLTRADGRLQIRVQLTDAERGVLLWSDRLSEDVENIFAMEEEVVRQIVSALAIRLTGIERERAFEKPTDSLDAYDLVLRGRELLRKATRTANFEARRLFQRAAALDSDYAGAYVGDGWSHLYDYMFGWTERPGRSLDRASGLAERAIVLDRENADAHTLLAYILRFRGELEVARRHIDIALEINPNRPKSLVVQSVLLLAAGNAAEAVPPLELAIRLDPSPQTDVLFSLSEAYYQLERYGDAVAVLERHAAGFEEDAALFAILAAAQAQLGRDEAARAAAESVRRASPFFEAEDFVEALAHPSHRDHLLEGLRKAGL